jgi:hypothetical protein
MECVTFVGEKERAADSFNIWEPVSIFWGGSSNAHNVLPTTDFVPFKSLLLIQ